MRDASYNLDEIKHNIDYALASVILAETQKGTDDETVKDIICQVEASLYDVFSLE